MAKKALFDTNPGAGRLTIYGEEDGKTFIETRQDCEHIVAAAKMLSEETPGKDFRHIGFIPDVVLNQMLIDGSFSDPKAIKRFLAENPDFRTTKGRL